MMAWLVARHSEMPVARWAEAEAERRGATKGGENGGGYSDGEEERRRVCPFIGARRLGFKLQALLDGEDLWLPCSGRVAVDAMPRVWTPRWGRERETWGAATAAPGSVWARPL